jgi:hypothetical protein
MFLYMQNTLHKRTYPCEIHQWCCHENCGATFLGFMHLKIVRQDTNKNGGVYL